MTELSKKHEHSASCNCTHSKGVKLEVQSDLGSDQMGTGSFMASDGDSESSSSGDDDSDHHHHHHDHEHHEGCSHGHSHSHSHQPAWMMILGFVLFVIAIFIPTKGIQDIVYLMSVLLTGSHVIIDGFVSTYQESKREGKFKPNLHILMALAALGAMAMGNFSEAALLILIFSGAHFLEDYTESKSRDEITKLLNLNPKEARLVIDEHQTEIVSAYSLKVGQILKVLPGDTIAADGMILEGSSSINESNLSGESVPVDKSQGSNVFAGTLNETGHFTMRVTQNPSDSVMAKIIEMVQSSQSDVPPLGLLIRKFESTYVTGVMVVVVLYILILSGLKDFNTAFYQGMVLLTVASPCALAASVVPATLAGLSKSAKSGVLIKGGNYLAAMEKIDMIAFDKTGTLTQGKPELVDLIMLVEHENALDTMVAMEKTSNHPLAHAFLESVQAVDILDLDVRNIIGEGLTTSNGYRLGKPTTADEPNTKLALEKGQTVVHFEYQSELIGVLVFEDVAHDNAHEAINRFKRMGIETVVVSGDHFNTVKHLADNMGIKQFFAGVLPKDKLDIVKEMQTQYTHVAMVGDGINDAPALKQAQFGIAMGAGTDVAIEVSDAVIMKNDLLKLADTIDLSKRLNRIIIQNIAFSMGMVAILVVLNFMGRMSLPLGVFAHETSTIIVLLNSLRLLK